MLEMLDYTIRIGSTPTFLYFADLYLCSAYAAHYVYLLLGNMAGFSGPFTCTARVFSLTLLVRKQKVVFVNINCLINDVFVSMSNQRKEAENI